MSDKKNSDKDHLAGHIKSRSRSVDIPTYAQQVQVQHNYHDRANIVPPDPTDDLSRYRQPYALAAPFPLKLHETLDRIEQDGHAHVISWQPHGRCFVIHDHSEFKKLLPTYFGSSKMTSFTRQLNLYGFQRITTGKDRNGYYHEFFLRGKAYLTIHISRTRVKGTGVRPKSNPDQEPDFWSMPWVDEGEKAKKEGMIKDPGSAIGQQGTDTVDPPKSDQKIATLPKSDTVLPHHSLKLLQQNFAEALSPPKETKSAIDPNSIFPEGSDLIAGESYRFFLPEHPCLAMDDDNPVVPQGGDTINGNYFNIEPTPLAESFGNMGTSSHRVAPRNIASFTNMGESFTQDNGVSILDDCKIPGDRASTSETSGTSHGLLASFGTISPGVASDLVDIFQGCALFDRSDPDGISRNKSEHQSSDFNPPPIPPAQLQQPNHQVPPDDSTNEKTGISIRVSPQKQLLFGNNSDGYNQGDEIASFLSSVSQDLIHQMYEPPLAQSKEDSPQQKQNAGREEEVLISGDGTSPIQESKEVGYSPSRQKSPPDE